MKRTYKAKDHFFKEAKAHGLRARSAYKLEELAGRFKLFRKGQRVLDLGAAPGGFLQVIAREVGPTGSVWGVDLVEIRSLGNPIVSTRAMDVLADNFHAELDAWCRPPLHAVVSDLAPKTTGIRNTDEARSLALAGIALDAACRKLVPGGHFAAKLFMGGDFELFLKRVKAEFGKTQVVRPEASRGGSMEIYVIGLGRHPRSGAVTTAAPS